MTLVAICQVQPATSACFVPAHSGCDVVRDWKGRFRCGMPYGISMFSESLPLIYGIVKGAVMVLHRVAPDC